MTYQPSISLRVTWALTGLVSLAVGLACGTAYYVQQRMEQRLIASLVTTESERLRARVAEVRAQWDEPFEREIGPVMWAWGEHPSRPAASMPPQLRELSNGFHLVDNGVSTWHVLVADSLDGRFYVAYDSIENDAQTDQFGLALLAMALVFMLASFIVSARVSRWVVSPLQQVTDRLARWAPGPPSNLVSRADEAGRLLEAFNRLQDQVDASIADQREFSANLLHEVRTPLAVIRTDGEMLLRFPQTASQCAVRVRRIIGAVDDINGALESTYSLSRAQGGTRETADMAECVADIFSSLAVEAENAGLALHNRVAPGHTEVLNRYALLTVARNIVRNAILHAAPCALEVRSVPGGLRFVDSGPGIPAGELPLIFERYFSGGRRDVGDGDSPLARDRTGLGLAIARRVCTLQGWRLDVHSPVADGRGTAFVLLLRPTDHDGAEGGAAPGGRSGAD